MVKLTIFTPTYNRKNTLILGYEALCRQTKKEFIWLIIDDGSTDGTSELVHGWMLADNGFEIQYVYKENGGLHTGYNKAIELIETELCVCIDSVTICRMMRRTYIRLLTKINRMILLVL